VTGNVFDNFSQSILQTFITKQPFAFFFFHSAFLLSDQQELSA